MIKAISTLLFIFLSTGAYALEVPALRGHINDYAGMVPAGSAERLEAELTAFEKTDSTQIVVLTIPSLEGEVLEEFSIKVADKWRIGQKKIDNGVILLISKADRKLRIEVGRGLEGKLTDLLSGRIIRNEIRPRFKNGDYDGGITAGVSAIISAVRGEYTASSKTSRQDESDGVPYFTIAIFLFFAITFLGGIKKIFGGVTGAVGIPLLAGFAFPGMSLIMLILLIAGGFGIGMLLSAVSGKGGGFMGGGFGGGGFGGGGFGGFSGGGGGFGGGGSSGSW